jgi:hypothetical protein
MDRLNNSFEIRSVNTNDGTFKGYGSVFGNIDSHRDVVDTPELSLNSNARASADAQPVMLDAVVRNCMGYADFDHVKARIEHFLPK